MCYEINKTITKKYLIEERVVIVRIIKPTCLYYAVPFKSRSADIDLIGILHSLQEKENDFTFISITICDSWKEFKKCHP